MYHEQNTIAKDLQFIISLTKEMFIDSEKLKSNDDHALFVAYCFALNAFA